MQNILSIYKLHDFYHHVDFGYIGVDIDTNQLSNFSHYDKYGLFHKNRLYEFKECKSDNLNESLKYCNMKKLFHNNLPKQLDALLEINIKKQQDFNLKHRFTNDLLDKNIPSLKLRYGFGEKIEDSINYDGVYIPLKNIIEISVSDYLWMMYTDKQKKDVSHHLLKELGHVKVTSKKLNNNMMEIKIGFLEYQLKCEKVDIDTNQTLYIPYKIKSLNYPELAYAFEEIFNEYECFLIDKTFKTRYQFIMDKLYQLTNGKILFYRYQKNGLSKLYNYLNNIIGNEKETKDLFKFIKDLHYTRDNDYLNESQKVLTYLDNRVNK